MENSNPHKKLKVVYNQCAPLLHIIESQKRSARQLFKSVCCIISAASLSACGAISIGSSPSKTPQVIPQQAEQKERSILPEPLPEPEKTKEFYPEALPVPNKPGYVFQPYTNQIVDVRGLTSGTLVLDPRDQPSSKRYFRVP